MEISSGVFSLVFCYGIRTLKDIYYQKSAFYLFFDDEEFSFVESVVSFFVGKWDFLFDL